MAKNKAGFNKRSLLFVLGALGMMGQANSAFIPNNHNQANVRDALMPKKVTGQTQESKKTFGGDNPYRYYRKFERNQRQQRKWLRQVPHLRRSKKSCIK